MLGLCQDSPVNGKIAHYRTNTARIISLEHFYLTDEEQRAIENNPLFKTEDGSEGAGPKQDEEAFALKHLVSDKFGVGDYRFSFLGHLIGAHLQKFLVWSSSHFPDFKHFVRGLVGRRI